MSQPIWIDGAPRHTGCLPRVGRYAEYFRPAADQFPTLDRSQWVTQEPNEWAKRRDAYQNGNNSCCLSSIAQALMLHLSLTGRADVDLDHFRIWSILTGGRNDGVAIQTAGQYIRQYGFPIKGSSEFVRVGEWADVEDAASFLSGRQRGWIGIYGRFIGQGGHAECAGYVRMIAGKAVIRVPGTWGLTYGENGWYDVTEADLVRGIPYFGGLLFRDVEIREADADGLPDVAA